MYYVKFGPEGYRIKPVVPPYITDEEKKRELLEKAKNGKLTGYEDYEVVEEVTFEEIAPEKLRELVENERKIVEGETRETWNEIVEPYLGKRLEDGDPVIGKIRERFITKTRMEVVAEIENVDKVSKADVALFAKEVEEYEPENRFIYIGDGKMHVDGYCDDEDIEVYGISYVLKVLVPIYPDEKALEKLAMQRAIFKHVGKAFRFDCEAIKDYMEGDLTFRGLIKKIDPRAERSC